MESHYRVSLRAREGVAIFFVVNVSSSRTLS